MRRRSGLTAALAAGSLLAAAPAVAAAAPAAAARVSATAAAAPAPWRSVAVPSSVIEPAGLFAVSAAGPASAWAVGQEATTGFQSGTPLILHWNGLAWSKAALPAGVAAPGSLTSVAASSPADAWALGTDAAGTVLLHWDGRAWTQARFPGEGKVGMNDVTAAPGRGAWLVGSVQPSGQAIRIVVEHWDGQAWHVVPTGLGPGSGTLSSASVARNGDVWAVGENDGFNQVIVVHEHDGTWTSMPGPDVSSAFSVLGVSGDDVWTTGNDFSFFTGLDDPVISQWNGTTWTSQILPSGIDGNDTTISADAAGQPQWAGVSAGFSPASTLYLSFAGGQPATFAGATPVSAPAGSFTFASTFTARIPGTNATWAVGEVAVTPSTPAPLIEFNAG
jgi:hypothetical protein